MLQRNGGQYVVFMLLLVVNKLCGMSKQTYGANVSLVVAGA